MTTVRDKAFSCSDYTRQMTKTTKRRRRRLQLQQPLHPLIPQRRTLHMILKLHHQTHHQTLATTTMTVMIRKAIRRKSVLKLRSTPQRKTAANTMMNTTTTVTPMTLTTTITQAMIMTTTLITKTTANLRHPNCYILNGEGVTKYVHRRPKLPAGAHGQK